MKHGSTMRIERMPAWRAHTGTESERNAVLEIHHIGGSSIVADSIRNQQRREKLARGWESTRQAAWNRWSLRWIDGRRFG